MSTEKVLKAVFSRDRKHRYVLQRDWCHPNDPANIFVMYIGLNPSRADEDKDDATITRCTQFAKNWGFNGLYMVNLFAYVSTDPKNMLRAPDPVGVDNHEWIKKISEKSSMVVAMWGANGDFGGQDKQVSIILKDRPMYCFGKTLEGFPKHPVRLGYDTELELFKDKGKTL